LVKLDKIYTRGGDKGQTSLGNGDRVNKNSKRILAYGQVDELNSSIGVVSCYCSENLKKILSEIQNDLFDIGADLCVPGKSKGITFNTSRVSFLEEELDKLNEKLDKLKSFVLPGGSKASAFLHLARTIARRTERDLFSLNEETEINDEILKYINRLSDFLFVAARFENKGDGDILWIPNKNQNKE